MKHINNIIEILEDSFNVSVDLLTEFSTLSHFEPEEIDMTQFLSEVDLEFDIDLEQVYGDKLLNTPLFEIAEYIERTKDEQNSHKN